MDVEPKYNKGVVFLGASFNGCVWGFFLDTTRKRYEAMTLYHNIHFKPLKFTKIAGFPCWFSLEFFDRGTDFRFTRQPKGGCQPPTSDSGQGGRNRTGTIILRDDSFHINHPQPSMMILHNITCFIDFYSIIIYWIIIYIYDYIVSIYIW